MTAPSPSVSAPKTRQPGWWYPWIFVGGMGVVVAVNMTLFYFANSTFSGLVTEHAYDEGVAYNRTVAEAAAQEALGWRVTSEVIPAPASPGAGGGRDATLSVEVKGPDGTPLSGLQVRALLVRPTQSGHDVRTELAEQGGGHYAAAVHLPFDGLWDVRVMARAGRDEVLTGRRLTIQ